MDFGNIINGLLDQMTLFHPEAGNYIMIVVALVFLYPAIKEGSEPLLLIPIVLDMLLANIYPDIIYSPEQTSNGAGEPPWYFFQLDEWSTLPSPVFLGVGTVTDFGSLIANPIDFLMGAAAQLGIYSVCFFTTLLGFSGREPTAISIIGGVGSSISLSLCSKLGQVQIMEPIAVAAYSYIALAPITQPPSMRLLITEKERKTKMEQLHPVSKLEKILFPIIVTIVVRLILSSTVPLVGMLMLGNLFHESGVAKQLADMASDALVCIVITLLDISVGTTANAEAFLNVTTIKIVALGLTAFIFDTADGVLLSKLLYKITRGRINPLINSVGVSAVPMTTHVSQKVGVGANPTNFLLIHAIGSNVTGVTGTTVMVGTFMAVFGV